MVENNCATIATLRAEMDKLNKKLAAINEARMIKKMYDQKLERLKRYIQDFLDEEPGYRRAHRRFLNVPIYREASGYPRADPLDLRIDEENNQETTVTFYVSTPKLRQYVDAWWAKTFQDDLCVSVSEMDF
jgi:hypothetical protein